METVIYVGSDLAILAAALALTGRVLETRRLDPWAITLAIPATALLAAWNASRGLWFLAALDIALFGAAAWASLALLRRRRGSV